MPKRTDLQTILVIGSGPIVIGQACEFDYSGTQACRALMEEGFRVVLINSNPATIMTDPELASVTYVEPMTPSSLQAILAREKPQALLPTMGGQTALNLALDLHDRGILAQYGVELIGANAEAIRKAEDRHRFKACMASLGIDMPRSGIVESVAEAENIVREQGLPAIIRPSFTLGGSGGGIAHTLEELREMVDHALTASPTTQALIEESVLGWKEYELEVMRDHADNVVIICSIENLDPMGLHTGDSITVAPAQTLSDAEYQHLRNLSLAIIRAIGVDTGGSNIQFAVHPQNGRVVVIEMNPRVSRSSALASKATGFPIAKIAAKLAVGFRLDELPNDITKKTPACFEPSIDYVVTKIPRFTFEKFPTTRPVITTQMKSVGEAMAIGRVFRESFQKALRSLETGLNGLNEILPPRLLQARETDTDALEERETRLRRELAVPGADRIRYLADAIRSGWDDAKLHAHSRIDPWFLAQLRAIIETETEIRSYRSHDRDDADRDDAAPAHSAPDDDDRDDVVPAHLDADTLLRWKAQGFADARLAQLMDCSEQALRRRRQQCQVLPTYQQVDTCAAEFEAHTPYFYSSYERNHPPHEPQDDQQDDQQDEPRATRAKRVLIIGSGPNRIGQGIEFDYCCVHAALTARRLGWEAIMVNCNPETVSTDYDISDRLYFEPITTEDILALVAHEKPDGVILQLGGQTPLKLAADLHAAGVRILGTPFDSIDRTEDRERFAALLAKLGLKQPPHGTARHLENAEKLAETLGYPVMLRPSYVLGGRAMGIAHDATQLRRYFSEAQDVAPKHPVLIDKFLTEATEVDVDVLADGQTACVGGIMEHIELAGVHSGDSACCLPPHRLAPALQAEVARQANALALELDIVGLMNVQFAIQGDEVYLLEVNPRGSRTVPFVSKAIGTPLAKIGTASCSANRWTPQKSLAPKKDGSP